MGHEKVKTVGRLTHRLGVLVTGGQECNKARGQLGRRGERLGIK